MQTHQQASGKKEQRKRSWISHKWDVFYVFFVLCVMTLPWVSALWNCQILGEDERIGDRANTLWFHHYAAEVWNGNGEFGQTDAFLYPVGVDLWAELFNVVDALVAIPFVWVFGWGTHYSVMIVVIALLNVWTGALWALRWTPDRRFAWLLGLLFAGGTAIFDAVENGRLVQTGLWVVPLALCGLDRLRMKGDWQSGLWAGLAVGFAGAWYLYWGYGLVLLSLLLCPWTRAWKELGWWVYAISGFLIATLNFQHLDLQYLASQTLNLHVFPTVEQAFTPEHYDTAGAILETALPIGWFGWSEEQAVPISLTLLWLLGGFTMLRHGFVQRFQRSQAWIWIGGGWLLFFLLGMGPYWMGDEAPLYVSGMFLQNPIYLWMYAYVPLIARMHWLGRWLPFLAALMIPIAAQARLGTAKGRIFGLVPLVLLLEWGLRGELQPTSTVKFESSCMAEMEKGQTPILLIPFRNVSRAAVYQPIHQHPIVNPISVSYEEERWPEVYQAQFSGPLMNWLQQTDQPIDDITPNSTVLQSLKKMGVSYIVYHRGYLQDALYDPKAPKPLLVNDQLRIQSIEQGFGDYNCSDDHTVVWKIQ